MKISVSGAKFDVDSQGFGAHDESASAAIRHLKELLSPYKSQQLDDAALLKDLAEKAAYHETSAWRCWQPGYGGDLPMLLIKRVAP